MSFFKKLIKKILHRFGYDIRRKATASAPASAPSTNTPARKQPFSASIYNPRWRLKNYYALQEFGPSVKRWFIEQKYSYTLGEFPDLDHPRKFNEKIHWLNLNYQDERITRCCDKYELKNYVNEVLGDGYSVPVIKTYERAADINFDELPDRFAIKVNWGDGPEFMQVVSDKAKADENAIKFKMNNAIQPWNNLYYSHFFWGYKNVKGRIYVEEYVEHSGTDLNDYKFHCFNGEPKFVLVCEERSHKRMKKTFLNLEWEILPCHRADGDVNPNVEKPANYDEMLRIVSALCKPFPFVRVDLYNANGRLYVGEMTFHPGTGLESFIPEQWNTIVGDMLELPEPRILEKDERY